MFPEIFRFGPIALYTYGFMMMLAFFLGIILAARRGVKLGVPSAVIWDLSVWILISSLIGARALYVFTHVDEFKGNWISVISPVQPDGRVGIAGMVLLGGIFTATSVTIYIIKKRQLDLWKIADVIAPSLALGIALGRIGCFANGCCYGHPTHSWVGVVFPAHSIAGSEFPNTPILPTQLFESAWGFILMGFLIFADRWRKFDGYTFSLFLIGYALFRIWIDTVRIYLPSEIIFGQVTISQGLSVVMIIFGIILFIQQRKAPVRRVIPNRRLHR